MLRVSRIYDDLATTPAGILKIAAGGDDATECIPIFRLLEVLARERREMIAIAMGQPGLRPASWTCLRSVSEPTARLVRACDSAGANQRAGTGRTLSRARNQFANPRSSV